MSMWDVLSLLNLTRDQLDDEEKDQWDDEDLMRYFDYAIGYYDLFMAEYAINQIMVSTDISHDGSTELSRIAPFLGRVMSIERTSDSPRTETLPMEGGFQDRFKYLSASVVETRSRWYFQGNQLGILPVGASNATDRVWTMKQSPGLHYGTAEGGGNTSITFMASPTYGTLHGVDDVYNEVPIVLPATRESNIVTDYVASTRVATCGFTWGSNPGATTLYSTLPIFPEQAHPLIAFRAIRLGNMRTDESNMDIDQELMRLEALLKAFIGQPQKQRPRYVRQYGWL